MRLESSWICSVLVLMIGTGCVSWYHAPRAVPVTATRQPAKTKLALEIEFHTTVKGVRISAEQREKARKMIRDVALTVFQESGRYQVVDEGHSAPYRLILVVTNSGDPNIGLAVLSGLTLLVIPAVTTDEYSTEVLLKSQSGQVIETQSFQHSLTTLMQLLLLPATPFAFPSTQADRMFRAVSIQILTWTDGAVSRYTQRPPPAAAPLAAAPTAAGSTDSAPPVVPPWDDGPAPSASDAGAATEPGPAAAHDAS